MDNNFYQQLLVEEGTLEKIGVHFKSKSLKKTKTLKL